MLPEATMTNHSFHKWTIIAGLALSASLTSGCVVVSTAGSVAGTAVKTTAKVGGAVVEGAVDAVDDDDNDDDESEGRD